MNKNDLVGKIALETGVTKTMAAKSLEPILGSITEALVKGDGVQLVGFGTFFVKEKKSRNGRNPRTGAKIHIPPKMIATFKPGKAFRMLVNDGMDDSGADESDDE